MNSDKLLILKFGNDILWGKLNDKEVCISSPLPLLIFFFSKPLTFFFYFSNRLKYLHLHPWTLFYPCFPPYFSSYLCKISHCYSCVYRFDLTNTIVISIKQWADDVSTMVMLTSKWDYSYCILSFLSPYLD